MPKVRFAYRSTLPKPDDPDIIERFADALTQGFPINDAATRAGIGAMTARDWLAAGEAQLADYRGRLDDEQAIRELGSHAYFASRAKQSEMAFVERNLAHVNGACAPDAKGWLPAMTLLERRRPADFGRRDRLQVDQRSVSVNVSVTLGPEAATALLDALSHAGQLDAHALSLQEGGDTEILDPPG